MVAGLAGEAGEAVRRARRHDSRSPPWAGFWRRWRCRWWCRGSRSARSTRRDCSSRSPGSGSCPRSWPLRAASGPLRGGAARARRRRRRLLRGHLLGEPRHDRLRRPLARAWPSSGSRRWSSTWRPTGRWPSGPPSRSGRRTGLAALGPPPGRSGSPPSSRATTSSPAFRGPTSATPRSATLPVAQLAALGGVYAVAGLVVLVNGVVAAWWRHAPQRGTGRPRPWRATAVAAALLALHAGRRDLAPRGGARRDGRGTLGEGRPGAGQREPGGEEPGPAPRRADRADGCGRSPLRGRPRRGPALVAWPEASWPRARPARRSRASSRWPRISPPLRAGPPAARAPRPCSWMQRPGGARRRGWRTPPSCSAPDLRGRGPLREAPPRSLRRVRAAARSGCPSSARWCRHGPDRRRRRASTCHVLRERRAADLLRPDDLLRRHLPRGGAAPSPSRTPDFLVNPTNDAWYGYSSGPYQFLAIVRHAGHRDRPGRRAAGLLRRLSADRLPHRRARAGALEVGPVDPDAGARSRRAAAPAGGRAAASCRGGRPTPDSVISSPGPARSRRSLCSALAAAWRRRRAASTARRPDRHGRPRPPSASTDLAGRLEALRGSL